MGFYPDVKPGDAFKPSAALENDVRHMINRINGFMGGTITAGKTIGSLCVKGYNPTSDETIAEGDVVAIPQGALSEDGSFPVATMTDDEYAKAVERWGIAQEEIGPGGVGAVLIMGAAIVPIVSETGTDTFDFVEPVGNGGSFKKSKRGIAKYVRPVGTDHALIFVGISSGLVYEQGKGVKITGGTYGIPPVISSEITGGTDIDVSGGTDGQPYVISYTGSGGGGGGGGIGFPDYLALNKLPSGGSMPSGEGIGTTYLLPVPAGKSIKYYSPLQYCVALFAVADGWDGTPHVLTNDTAYTTPAAGWVRISILDDGQHQNGCLRFYVGTSDWSKALPLYRCGTFRVGATGISSTISGSTAAKISLTGGTGSVIIKPGNNNVSIDGSTAGVIKISATGGGGGGGFIPAWSNTGHTDVIPISSSMSGSGYTANADGWIFACAYFDPAGDRMRYKNYDAHVVVDYGSMKVAELKLPSGTAFVKVENSSTKYYRNPGEDYSSDPYAQNPYYSYFAWQAGEDGPIIYTASVTPVVGDLTYTYDDEEEDFVESQTPVDDTNSAAYAVGVGSGLTIPVRAGATIYFIATADGYAINNRYSTPYCFCVFYSSNPPASE